MRTRSGAELEPQPAAPKRQCGQLAPPPQDSTAARAARAAQRAARQGLQHNLAAVGLPTLPLELLEAIGQPLCMQDRLALTSCCAALRLRPDVLDSPGLWGDVSIRLSDGARPNLTCPESSWLVKRAPGLRQLVLHMGYRDFDFVPLLRSLAAAGASSSLVRLKAYAKRPPKWAAASLFSEIGRLTALTHLDLTSFAIQGVTFNDLSSLQSLAVLEARGNPWVGVSCGSGLEHLTALTRMDLRWCGMHWGLPDSASALARLADLDLDSNVMLTSVREDCWTAVSALQRLTRLVLSHCNLRRVPVHLSAVTALKELSLASNYELGRADGAFQPLHHLVSLTRLDISHCCAWRALDELCQLSSLQQLKLGSDSLSYRVPGTTLDEFVAGHSQLQSLPSLTRLEVTQAWLAWCPQQLSGLKAMAAVV